MNYFVLLLLASTFAVPVLSGTVLLQCCAHFPSPFFSALNTGYATCTIDSSLPVSLDPLLWFDASDGSAIRGTPPDDVSLDSIISSVGFGQWEWVPLTCGFLL